MITTQRKSKYKTKIVFSPAMANSEHHNIRDWCTEMFGPGGRGKNLRWRFGWTNDQDTYYFKNAQDATLFVMRWS